MLRQVNAATATNTSSSSRSSGNGNGITASGSTLSNPTDPHPSVQHSPRPGGAPRGPPAHLAKAPPSPRHVAHLCHVFQR